MKLLTDIIAAILAAAGLLIIGFVVLVIMVVDGIKYTLKWS